MQSALPTAGGDAHEAARQALKQHLPEPLRLDHLNREGFEALDAGLVERGVRALIGLGVVQVGEKQALVELNV